MSDKNTGGRAFPAPTTKPLENYYPGMTLRDYFAAKAISSVFVGTLPDKLYCEVAAERAYHMADAMLKARGA